MTEAQMAVLSRIAYLNKPPGKLPITMENFIQYYNDHPPKDYEKKAYDEAFAMIMSDPELKNLKISGYQNKEGFLQSGFVAYCFEQPTGDAVVAFRGTNGPGDLVADADLLLNPGLTTQQKQAIDFMNQKPPNGAGGYKNVEATGHSLGGFLAQTVTIYDKRVKNCITYNAPGFTPLFALTNMDRINAAHERIAKSGGNFLEYVTGTGPINHAGVQICETKKRCGGGHGMDNFIHYYYDEAGKPPKQTGGSTIHTGSGGVAHGGGGGSFGGGGSGGGFRPAGGKAMTKELKVEPDIVRKTAGEMLSVHHQMSQTMTNINETIQSLKASWGGIVSATYLFKYNALKPSVDRMLDVAKEYAEDLNTIAGIYTATERQAQEAAETLRADNVFVI